MNALNAAQRMQKIERFEKLTMSEYEALVSVNEQLRQRVQELEELLKESYKDADEVLRPRVAELEKERDKAHQYWQIAEGRCDALMKQRDELLSDVERCYRMLLSEPDTQGALFKAENILREAIASVKEKA